MEVLRAIFQLNQPVIQFGYGLTFFVMGLTIALQSRSSSRLSLARDLRWLAVFGITNSLYEWGELFSPVHERYLTAGGVVLLHDIHLIFLSVSFLFLFEFGIALLRPLGKGRWIHGLTLFLLAGYILSALIMAPRFLLDPIEWHETANAIARYLICFPAALLAAYGLREQTVKHIAPLNVPHIVKTLRLAGLTLAAYAVIGGLIPPPVDFFPGNILNSITFEQVVGVPPIVFEAVIGLMLAVTIIRALEVFQVETDRRIELMEQQQILTSERERLARELHDGSIQTVYTAGLLVDSARKLAEPDTPISGRLDKAVDVLNDAIYDLRRNLSELHSPPTAEDFSNELRKIATDPKYRSLVDVSLNLDIPTERQFSPLRADHVLAIVKESLSNIVRHSHASNAHLKGWSDDCCFHLEIQDDGTGIRGGSGQGYGLRNMQDRARLLGGKFSLTSEPGAGTRITLEIPWEDEHYDVPGGNQ
jgi:signal transduction histidine kinase